MQFQVPPVCKIHEYLGDALFTLFFGVCFSAALDKYQSKGLILVLIFEGLALWGIGSGCLCARFRPSGVINTRSGRIPIQCFFQVLIFGVLVFLFSLTVYWRNEFSPRNASDESSTYTRISLLFLRWFVILSTGFTSCSVLYQLTPTRMWEDGLRPDSASGV